jgi:hypothetical protein
VADTQADLARTFLTTSTEVDGRRAACARKRHATSLRVRRFGPNDGGIAEEESMVKATLSMAALGIVWLIAGAASLGAQTAPASPLPADPWPREVSIPGAMLLVYQPQVSSWQGNALAF